MFLERRTVSRKTPNDGKLEITKPVAARIRALDADLTVEMGGHRGALRLGAMPCTCRGEDRAHEHYFLESDLLRTLTPSAVVELDLDASSATISVRPAH